MRACSMPSVFFLRFPRRGGNYNNTSNTGLGYVNSNNVRGNSNVNYGVRSAPSSTYICKAQARPWLRSACH